MARYQRIVVLTGTLRPHGVWFGKMPLAMDEILAALMP